jgi:hypothetical protein
MSLVYVILVASIMWGTTAAAVFTGSFPPSVHVYAAIATCSLPTLAASLVCLARERWRNKKISRSTLVKLLACNLACLLFAALIVPFRVQDYNDTRNHARQILQQHPGPDAPAP